MVTDDVNGYDCECIRCLIFGERAKVGTILPKCSMAKTSGTASAQSFQYQPPARVLPGSLKLMHSHEDDSHWLYFLVRSVKHTVIDTQAVIKGRLALAELGYRSFGKVPISVVTGRIIARDSRHNTNHKLL